MKLSSRQLEAFFETVKHRSFTRAAAALGLTQSALSQRIGALESDLETTLFLRESGGPVLTRAGETLLRHCETTRALETEVLSALRSGTAEVAGVMRIAGYSSITRSILMPSLAPFLRSHPRIDCSFQSYETSELPALLRGAGAELAVSDERWNRADVIEHVLGREEYVVIESIRHRCPEALYLDHDMNDRATESYLRTQGRKFDGVQRRFMGDVYGVLEGVRLGFGRAVMSRHLLSEVSGIREIKGFKPYYREVVLHYSDRPFYSELHKKVVAELVRRVPEMLSNET